jgi:hypothetical protein
MPVRDENGDDKHHGMFPGLVVDNLDPQKRGRVKVEVPGLCEPSTNWALPIGGSHSSGEANRGGFDPPKVGAAVVVAFLDGDIDHPVYLGGWRAAPGGVTDAPTMVTQASKEDAATKLKVYETDAYTVAFNEGSTGPTFAITHKASATRVEVRDNQIEIICGDRILRVQDGKIQLGGSAAEAIVKGSTWWAQQAQELTQHSAGLQAAAAGCIGPTASLQPGLMAAAAALQSLLSFGNNDQAFLSKKSFTE